MSNIFTSANEVTVKYDYVRENHFVYFGLNDNVRRLSFPTKDEAMRLVNSLSCYGKVRMS